MPVAAILPFLPMILGGAQALIGGGLLAGKRPEYQIPSAVTNATNIARMRAAGDMPGYTEAQDRNSLAASNAIAAARDSGDASNMAPIFQAVQSKGATDIGVANAQWKDQATQAYMNQLAQLAQFQDQKWQMNEFAPYKDRIETGQAMLGAGLQNVTHGLDIMNAKSMLSDMIGGTSSSASSTTNDSGSGNMTDAQKMTSGSSVSPQTLAAMNLIKSKSAPYQTSQIQPVANAPSSLVSKDGDILSKLLLDIIAKYNTGKTW